MGRQFGFANAGGRPAGHYESGIEFTALTAAQVAVLETLRAAHTVPAQATR